MKETNAKDNLDTQMSASNRLEKKLVQSEKEKKNEKDKLAKMKAFDSKIKAKIISFKEVIDSNNSMSAEVSELAEKYRK